MITKVHRFYHNFESIKNADDIVTFPVQLEVHFHFAREVFTSLSIQSNTRVVIDTDSEKRRIDFAMTRTTIGSRDDIDIQRNGYDVTTIFSTDPYEAAQAAMDHHLWAWIPNGKDIGQLSDEYHRMSFLDQVVAPLVSIVMHACRDPQALDELANRDSYQFIPYWQIQLGFGPLNREGNEWFARGMYLGDVFVSSDTEAITAIKSQVYRSQQRAF